MPASAIRERIITKAVRTALAEVKYLRKHYEKGDQKGAIGTLSGYVFHRLNRDSRSPSVSLEQIRSIVERVFKEKE